MLLLAIVFSYSRSCRDFMEGWMESKHLVSALCIYDQKRDLKEAKRLSEQAKGS